MSALNLSTNGQSINRSYQAVIDAPPPSAAAASSGTYGQWAVFSVTAPLASAFQDMAGKESVLKVQGSGDGDLGELIDEFSDGRIQFAFLKVKDPNTSLPKYALICWCGEGVPERTKGYFTSHVNAVSKVLTGYHVQITARSDRDLTPEGIMQKISDASGSKYSGGGASVRASAPPPKPASKPVFMPTQTGGPGTGFNPLAGARRAPIPRIQVDADGWGEDAPPVTRTQVEKVPSAYQPTKVNMRSLASQGSSTTVSSNRNEAAAFNAAQPASDVVKGGYQPVGKVDIAALRREAAASSTTDNRPTPVKGSYEPVGKVDIAAIRARVRQDEPAVPAAPAAEPVEKPASTATRAAVFSSSGAAPLTELPKPKVANKFGSSSTFTGTKAPLPGGLGTSAAAPAGTIGSAGRSFADSAGKTPAQLWAEKKGLSGGKAAVPAPPPAAAAAVASPITSQTSGGSSGWKSGYTGKSWARVQTTRTGQSAASGEGGEEQEQQEDIPSGRVGALAEALGTSSIAESAPAPPPLETATKPFGGAPTPAARAVPIPPPQTQPRTPTPEPEEEEAAAEAERAESPIRIAMPVSHTQPAEIEDARDEQFSPPPAMPIRSLAQEAALHEEAPEAEDEPEPSSATDPARGAATAVAGATFGEAAVHEAPSHTAAASGQRAEVLYSYEKTEDNEIDLVEGQIVSQIEQVDPDWWMGMNAQGEMGLFPSNYVQLMESTEDAGTETVDEPGAGLAQQEEEADPNQLPPAPTGPSAKALYDYEAGEDNELTFPEDAVITNVSFPDQDWWAGIYNGNHGLFPAAYVQILE